VGWHHRIVGQSIVQGTPFEAFLMKDGIDGLTIEGAAELPYEVGAHKLEVHNTKVGVPVLWWRSVGSTHTAYAVETMMDRLASAAGVDPLEFRLRNMTKAPREAEALRLAAQKAGWGKPSPEGVYRGLAVHKSFDSYVAQVADVQIDGEDMVKIAKVTCAIDCGIAVVPDQISAQMEGSIGYGLGAIMRNKITLTDGEVDQFNFTDYEPIRMYDMPDISVHIVTSTEAPTGVGEPGVPPVGPAVANALFAARGQVVTSLPMEDNGVSFA
jgi:isoquinoline 1-oxidoreductase beta subunit